MAAPPTRRSPGARRSRPPRPSQPRPAGRRAGAGPRCAPGQGRDGKEPRPGSRETRLPGVGPEPRSPGPASSLALRSARPRGARARRGAEKARRCVGKPAMTRESAALGRILKGFKIRRTGFEYRKWVTMKVNDEAGGGGEQEPLLPSYCCWNKLP
ncbi:translation initiation factor IF-2-like [Canis lupus dingo]|uniref:translation initiation factor IF-2-like n=1 Tax=Canis lupus dingo TaxID=286419 RepID=UPI0020C2C7B0|nr:translation initiation factor IF-2-like [Canis lupus dingo]